MKLRRETGISVLPGFSGGTKRRVVRHRRVAAHAVDVLHPPLGRQPVVVPAERVEDRLAGHPLVPGDDVRVREGEHVPDVQRPGHGGRRRVDRVHLGPRPGPVEPVYLVGLPAYAPYRLKSVESGLVGHGGSARLVGIGHVPTVLSGGDRPSLFTLARARPARLGGDQAIIKRIAAELAVRDNQVAAAVDLLDGGATVPFIARYRKEATGTLDDAQLRTLDERLRYLRELEERRAAILASIEEQGKLTDELRAASTRPTPRRGWKTSTCRTSRSGGPRRRSPARTASSPSPTCCSATRPPTRARRRKAT